eukprot:CAMPEP_0119431932 /NCGR_PEP_ID=MMETSP1335-20130426/46858_1 /TAXON_ID=259385 /ORGANISM="Chrysoculter rhomboideus, Strain RCC1486" /LENGTH=175 /DNA_ID=CAMNT_0007457743 /DNA_START=1 /DNA_END=525 /DNA_ORIENTATION=-
MPMGGMAAAANPYNKTVHIGNLPPACTPDVIRQLFSHFGAIVDVRFGGNAKYAFVDYAEPASAQAAMQMNQYDLWGFRLRVEAASSFRQNAPAAPVGGAYGGAPGYGADPNAAAYAAAGYAAPPSAPPGAPPQTAYQPPPAAYQQQPAYADAQPGAKRPRYGEPGASEPTTREEC